MERRLGWLGHLGRMSDDRLPKQLLFGELQKTQPFHGTEKHWRDGDCLTSRPLVLMIVGNLSARIGCS